MFRTLSANDSSDVRKTSAFDAWAKAEALAAENKFNDALFWYERAAAKGNMNAAAEIGFLYQHGLGVNVNYPLAASWYEAAANRGNMVGMQLFAVLLFKGLGVSQDQTRARVLVNKAYLLGNSDSAFVLADLYEHGVPGIPPQPDLSQLWYQRGYAELQKAYSLCYDDNVRKQMAQSIARMLEGLYTTPTSTVVFSVIAGTDSQFKVPPAKEEAHQVIKVKPTMRHGESEAECDATFSIDPTLWSFRVTRTDNGRYLVRAATGTQWFQLMALRAMAATNRIRTPLGLRISMTLTVIEGVVSRNGISNVSNNLIIRPVRCRLFGVIAAPVVELGGARGRGGRRLSALLPATRRFQARW